MYNGERGEEEDDQKPPALPQHAQTITMQDKECSNMSTLTLRRSNPSLLHLATNASEPPHKRIKLEGPLRSRSSLEQLAAAAVASDPDLSGRIQQTLSSSNILPAAEDTSENDSSALPVDNPSTEDIASSTTPPPNASEKSASGVISPENSSTTASVAKSGSPAFVGGAPAKVEQDQQPLKATTFRHLRRKYLDELEYMLREFQKLERQLLGAGQSTNKTETAGSKERREKLHSFIEHLEQTVQQIISGCDLEAAGKSTVSGLAPEQTGLSDTLSHEKAEEENVQKLEEHILSNLLPVKVRLKKQLAAQQGARHNPAGMPIVRGGQLASDKALNAKATFKPAERRPSQFGKPLEGGGSSLTKKLHGSTLGSKSHLTAAKDGADEEKPKVLYAGMALGSNQMRSSVSAACSAHPMVIEDRALLRASARKAKTPPPPAVLQPPNVLASQTDKSTAAALSEEELRKLRKKRRKRKRIRQQQAVAAAQQSQQAKRRKGPNKTQRGPRSVEYMCALCNEVYASTCDYNPWWALTQQECPKCRKTQIPRVDITAPANMIEYHPALLAHADENAGGGAPAAAVMLVPPAPEASGSDSESDLSEDDLSDSDSVESSDSEVEDLATMSPADRAENEKFGDEYNGPKLSDDEASRLLTLMLHASTCPCCHTSETHEEVCRSTKWMMLHVRDCPGTTSSYDVCPFAWCRKVKHLLYHLVSCTEPELCSICSPSTHNINLIRLQGLNDYRMEKHRYTMIQKAKAAEKAKAVAAKSSDQKNQDSSQNCAAQEATELAATVRPAVMQPVPATATKAKVEPNVTFTVASQGQSLPHPGAPKPTEQAGTKVKVEPNVTVTVAPRGQSLPHPGAPKSMEQAGGMPDSVAPEGTSAAIIVKSAPAGRQVTLRSSLTKSSAALVATAPPATAAVMEPNVIVKVETVAERRATGTDKDERSKATPASSVAGEVLAAKKTENASVNNAAADKGAIPSDPTHGSHDAPPGLKAGVKMRAEPGEAPTDSSEKNDKEEVDAPSNPSVALQASPPTESLSAGTSSPTHPTKVVGSIVTDPETDTVAARPPEERSGPEKAPTVKVET